MSESCRVGKCEVINKILSRDLNDGHTHVSLQFGLFFWEAADWKVLRTDQRLLHLERFRRERLSTSKVRHLFERSNWPALPQISTAIGWPMHSKFVFVHFEAFESSFQLNSVQLLASRLETNCPFFIDCHSTSFFYDLFNHFRMESFRVDSQVDGKMWLAFFLFHNLNLWNFKWWKSRHHLSVHPPLCGRSKPSVRHDQTTSAHPKRTWTFAVFFFSKGNSNLSKQIIKTSDQSICVLTGKLLFGDGSLQLFHFQRTIARAYYSLKRRHFCSKIWRPDTERCGKPNGRRSLGK